MFRLALLCLVACQQPDGGLSGGGKAGGGGAGGGDLDDTAGSADDTGDTGGGGETGETATPVGTGYQQGDVAYDLEGTDQNGDDWSLYEHLDQQVVLVVGNMDFGTVQSTLSELIEVHSAFPRVGLVALIGRDEYSIAADHDDASRWVTAYDLDTVLTDPTMVDVNLWSDDSSGKTYVIGADATIGLVLYGYATSDQIAAGLQG